MSIPGANPDDNRDHGRLIRSEEGRAAAAALLGSLVTEIASDQNSTPQTRENAVKVLEELGGNVNPTANQAVAVMEAPVAAPEYDIPDEVAQLLAEPDLEDDPDEDDLPLAAEAEETPEDDTDYVAYEDPDTADLKRKLKAAEKKADHERKLRVQTARKDWEAEALRVFKLGPLELLDADDVASITADSRKGFLREAKALADSRRKIAEKLTAANTGATIVSRPDPRKEQWGTPAVGAPSAAPESLDQQDRMARARRSGNLGRIFSERIRQAAQDE